MEHSAVLPEPAASSTKSPAGAGATPSGRGGPSLRARTILLTLVLSLAAFARLASLPAKEPWLDEWYSVSAARLAWPSFLSLMVQREANMALYYVVLRFWLQIDDSQVFVRLLSVLFALATLSVLYRLGSRIFGTPVGLTAALLLALNPFHVRYSQEMRSYSLLVLLLTLSTLLFVRCIERPALKNWALYVLATVAAMYSHLFGALLLPAHAASLALLPLRENAWRGMAWASGTAALLGAPLGLFAVSVGTGPISWLPKPELRSLVRLFYALTGGVEERTPLFLAYFLFCLVALASATRLWRLGRGTEAWRHGLVTCCLAIPVAITYGFSLLGRPVFIPRYLVICVPYVCLLAALGLHRLRPGWPRAVSLALLLALSAHGVYVYSRQPNVDNLGLGDWRAASHYVSASSGPGDGIIFYSWVGRLPFDYYHRRELAEAAEPVAVYPADWVRVQLLGPRGGPSDDEIATLPSRHRRIWLIFSLKRTPDWNRLETSLARHYTLRSERSFPGVQVRLYVCRDHAEAMPVVGCHRPPNPELHRSPERPPDSVCLDEGGGRDHLQCDPAKTVDMRVNMTSGTEH